MAKAAVKEENRYKALIEAIFFHHWKKGLTEFEFARDELEAQASHLGIALPKNLGDLLYSFKFRVALPARILATQRTGREWIIEGAGRSKYRFRLVPTTRIKPNENLISVAIPDATPEIIRLYKLDDEQALLAVVRYNRLIDIFLGLTAFSLQNHLRTSVKDVGQIEIDELYVGIDQRGCHYAIPVQAKGHKDQIGVVQTAQDVRYAAVAFPEMRCRPIAAQFMTDGVVALFELTLENDEVKVVDERHYRLVPATDIDPAAVTSYS
jgi:hypothetical protein